MHIFLQLTVIMHVKNNCLYKIIQKKSLSFMCVTGINMIFMLSYSFPQVSNGKEEFVMK